MKISTEALKRILFNVALFSGPKTATAGAVLFQVKSGTLTSFTSDDFILYVERVSVESSDEEFVLPLDRVKELTKEIKDSVEEFTEVEGDPVAEDSFWPILVSLGSRDWTNDSSVDFYVNPKRLSNLYRIRLEDKEDQPIGLRHSTYEGQEVLAFIYGPRVRGVITSMKLQTLLTRGCYTWADHDDPDRLEDDSESSSLEELNDPPWDEGPEFAETEGGAKPVEVSDEEIIARFETPEMLDGVRREHHKVAIGTRVQYDTAIVSSAPDHCNEDEWTEFGY